MSHQWSIWTEFDVLNVHRRPQLYGPWRLPVDCFTVRSQPTDWSPFGCGRTTLLPDQILGYHDPSWSLQGSKQSVFGVERNEVYRSQPQRQCRNIRNDKFTINQRPVQYTGCDRRMRTRLDGTTLAAPPHRVGSNVHSATVPWPDKTAECQRPTCPPVEPNPPLPRMVSSNS